jgi:hypothetical protein
MSTTFIGGALLPAVSQEFITRLEETYPAPTLEPGYNHDEALWAAAQHAMVVWIKKHASNTSTANPVAAQRAVVKLGS